MKKLSTLILITVASLAVAGGCKKKKDDGGTPVAGSGSDMAGSGTGMAGSGSDTMAGSGSGMAGSGSDTMAGSGSGAAEDTADKLEVVADHKDKAKGPVTVVFTGVKVVKATFDPAKVEGGTAELEVDLTGLSSGVEDRDTHLKSGDYIDVGKFAKLTIKIDNVKGAGEKKFTADATVKLRDIEKKIPVTFDVVDQTADSIRIKGEGKFSRLDFKVGKAADDAKEGVAPDLTAKLQLTLKKS